MFRFAFPLLLALLLPTVKVVARPGKIYLFPTLHRLHLENPNYSYDSLRIIVARIHPDIIAVEIRAEDIVADTAYLRGNYPYEMWMMPYWFPGTRTTGFDWLGDDIAGKPIPAGYWKETATIKKLERELRADSLFTASISVCDTAFRERMALLKELSLPELMTSNYHLLTSQFYACLGEKLRNSRFRYIPGFYARRNEVQSENCRTIIRKNPGKTIVILTGADHYGYIKDALEQNGLQLVHEPR